jgi:REP element-mobilizing transposase RayT
LSISSDIDTDTDIHRSGDTDLYSDASRARHGGRDSAASANLKTAPSNRVTEVERPRSERGFDAHVVLEPVAPHPYDLSYACLLIPRFNTHSLVGDIADNLYRWLGQVCLSFAWKLEYTTVRPEYLQWIMSVPATTPPSSFMHTIRQHTSRQIFEDFPRLKRENLSKDFWAPGYLVLVGTLPHSPDMIREFIRLTRQQQGILRK